MSYTDWYQEIEWLKNKVILPNGKRVSKDGYITKDGFDTEGFNKVLYKIWLNTDNKKDGRRYKNN